MTYWQGKAALITGGSAGLGLALARTLASRGAKVMVAGRNEARLRTAVTTHGENNPLSCFAADVTDDDQVRALVGATMERFGRLDLMVNNVGQSTRGNALDTSADQYRESLEVNFLSAVRCTQAAASHLMESQGHLVNIGSLASKTVAPFLGAYPPGKFALAAYTHQIRIELAPRGVHVLLVCPGPIARSDAGSRYDEQAADLPPSAREPGGGAKLDGIAPDRLAEHILRACQRRAPELVVPHKARWLFAISQLWPTLGDRIVKRFQS